MKRPLFILASLSFFIISVTKAQVPQSVAGNYISDLYPDTANEFTAMTSASWKLNARTCTAAMTSTCQVPAGESFPMLGGGSLATYPDTTGVPHHIDKQYNSLPSHQSVYYQIKAVFRDNFNAGFEIQIDGGTVFFIYPRNPIASDPKITCDSASYVPVTLIGSAPHGNTALTLKFISHDSTYLFGIRDVQIRLDPNPRITTGNCMVIQTVSNRNLGDVCKCDLEQYYSSSSCISCDPSCNGCFGSGINECFGCAEGRIFDANANTCSSCSDGCLLCSGPGIYQCLQCSAFIYANNSCITGCTTPYQQRGTTQYCDRMCTAPTPYFHEKDSQCYATCDSGIIKDSFICSEPPNTGTGGSGNSNTGTNPVTDGGSGKSTLTVTEKNEIETKAQTASIISDVTSTLGKTISMINFSNPGAIFMASFAELIKYIKYLRIDYPERLRYSLDLELELPLKIIPDAPDSLSEYLVQAAIPENFEGDDFHSSFLWNFWDSLITFAILGTGIVIVLLVKPCANKSGRAGRLINEAHQALIWNFSLPFFASAYGDIVIFSSFELQTAEYSTSSGLSIFSLALCCAFNLLAILAFIKMVMIVRTHWYEVIKGQNDQSKAIVQNRLSSYQVVYECCKQKSLYQQAFMPIFVARIYLYVTIIAYLYNYPVMQAMLITTLSAMMLLYLLITRPIQEWVDMANYVLQELVMLTVLMCTLILSALDSSDPDNTNARENLGEVIINSNIAFCAISLVYVMIQLFPLVKNGFQKLRVYLQKQKSIQNKYSDNKLKIKQVPRLDNSHNTSIDPLRDIEPVSAGHEILDMHENSSPQANFTKAAHRITRVCNRNPSYFQNGINY